MNGKIADSPAEAEDGYWLRGSTGSVSIGPHTGSWDNVYPPHVGISRTAAAEQRLPRSIRTDMTSMNRSVGWSRH